MLAETAEPIFLKNLTSCILDSPIHFKGCRQPKTNDKDTGPREPEKGTWE